VDLNTSNPITNASDVCVISEMAEHTSGSALLNCGSDNILTPLKTVDKNTERNKKRREAYQKMSVETQSKSFPAVYSHSIQSQVFNWLHSSAIYGCLEACEDYTNMCGAYIMFFYVHDSFQHSSRMDKH